jgi:hypothetical protein
MTFEGTVRDQGGEVVDITNSAYGAKGDTVVEDGGGATVAGAVSYTQSRRPFVPADVGKVVTVQGAGLNGAVLTTKIASYVSSTSVKLAAPAFKAVTNAAFSYGTDDTGAILKAIVAAGWLTPVYAPAGTYTILGASNTSSDNGGGKQIHLPSRGGLVGQGGKHDVNNPASLGNTTFVCADANAGLLFSGHARFEGFLVDGNNIATLPLKTSPTAGPNVLEPPAGGPVPTGGLPTGIPTGTSSGNGTQYSTFIDVWVKRSAGDGWSVFASQNVLFYDCGSTDNARDGVYCDMGTGGHDFFNFYERGNLRYGVSGDDKIPGGGFVYLPGDIQFFGGVFDAHPTRRGVSKIHLSPSLEWGFFDMDIVGTNLSGPTIEFVQTLDVNHRINRCRIWATPTGATPGNACIKISGTSERNGRQQLFLKTDGCSFLSGDCSVLFTESNGLDQCVSRGWVIDATARGPQAVGYVSSGTSVQHVTLPDADVLLQGRTGRWQTATLTAPWTGTVRYRVMAEGWVQLEGSAESSTGNAGRMFVLPLGYRPTAGTARSALVAVRDPAGSQHGVGQVTIQNGAATNESAGAVAYAPVSGSGAPSGATVVHLDGVWIPVRSNDGQMW